MKKLLEDSENLWEGGERNRRRTALRRRETYTQTNRQTDRKEVEKRRRTIEQQKGHLSWRFGHRWK